jgi:hypothetical protein
MCVFETNSARANVSSAADANAAESNPKLFQASRWPRHKQAIQPSSVGKTTAQLSGRTMDWRPMAKKRGGDWSIAAIKRLDSHEAGVRENVGLGIRNAPILQFPIKQQGFEEPFEMWNQELWHFELWN